MRLPFQISQRYALYGLGFLIILLCIYTVVGERGPIHLWRLRAEKAKLDERNYDLQKDNETLRQRIWRLRHDNFYLEKLAREELTRLLTDGFIPRVAVTELPETSRRTGLAQIALPYAQDPGITRHLAAFLTRQASALGVRGSAQRPKRNRLSDRPAEPGQDHHGHDDPTDGEAAALHGRFPTSAFDRLRGSRRRRLRSRPSRSAIP